MAAKVFFSPVRSRSRESFLSRLGTLAEEVGIGEVLRKGDMVAVKTHFGEPGNTAFLSPLYAGKIVEGVKARGARPFLTDTTTVYRGPRANAVDHLSAAGRNGFTLETVKAPLIIADGIRGENIRSVSISGEVCREIEVAGEILQADALIALAHFTGHEVAGFGGVIKTIAMGCCSQGAKFRMHSTISPTVRQEQCVGCSQCFRWCHFHAIRLESGKAMIDPTTCTGCGECIGVCPEGAIRIHWQTSKDFHKLLAEHALGVVLGKEKKALYFNFLLQIVPACDCFPFSDAPIVSDIGILASRDPVAVDRAALDLVDRAAGLPNTRLGARVKPHTKKFRVLYPDVRYEEQFEHAEKIGLGTQEYELIEV